MPASRPKIAVVGSTGLLGSQLCHYLGHSKAFEIFPLTHSVADVTDIEKLRAALKDIQPNWVINGAGFLNPDRCENDPDTSYAVNYMGAVHLAQAAGELGAILVHFSTDYVFDGERGGYDETSATAPLSHYGRHKLLADQALLEMQAPAYIFRIASVIGAGPGKMDIVKALLGRVASGAKQLEVINEFEISISTPQLIAHVIEEFIKEPPQFGIYNAVAEGKTTWFDVAKAAFSELEVNVPFVPVAASTLPRPAPRPMKSWLKTEKLAAQIGPVSLWQDVLADQMYDLRDEYLPLVEKALKAA